MSHELPLFLALLAFIPCSTALTNIFNFTSFSCNDQSLNCSGHYALNNLALDLTSMDITRGTKKLVGWAVYDKPIKLYDSGTGFAADFESNLSFEIIPTNINCTGDGLAFFVVHADWTPNENFDGEGLGIFNKSKDAVNSQIIAIEFDTFNNSIDPSPNHMEIDVNSFISSLTANWTSEVSGSLNATAVIGYDSRAGNLSSHLSYQKGTLDIYLDINPTTVLQETVVIGFSASTGSCREANGYWHGAFHLPPPTPRRLQKIRWSSSWWLVWFLYLSLSW